jgi:hypothetical protein
MALVRGALLAVLAASLLGCAAYLIEPVPTIALRTSEPPAPGSPPACMTALTCGDLTILP